MHYDAFFPPRSDAPFRVALVGCGEFGACLARQMRHIDSLKLVALCDRKVARALSISEEAGYSENARMHCDGKASVAAAMAQARESRAWPRRWPRPRPWLRDHGPDHGSGTMAQAMAEIMAQGMVLAMAQAMPGKMPGMWGGGEVGVSFGGYGRDRKAWVYLEFQNDGPCGGLPWRDGADGSACAFRYKLETVTW